MIIVTGGAGFIGSALVHELNNLGYEDIIIVDNLGESIKWRNLIGLKFVDYIDKIDFIERIESNEMHVPEVIFHLGACTSTTEKDVNYLMENNFVYSKILASWAHKNNVRFIYASSAATYGNGKEGFSDNEEELYKLKPLSPYALSKHLFDIWAYKNGLLKEFVGLKYFNVFGPNEYHKGDMRSVVLKGYEQIKSTGKIRLFKSHRKDYKHGEQMRDFIYVKDAVKVTIFFYKNPNLAGIYNVGTGHARTWNALAKAIFDAIGKKPNIEYIDMPVELREKYQYFTEANMKKLCKAGFKEKFMSLESAVKDYVQNYLEKGYLNICGN